MRRLDASSVDENLQKWGDSNRVSSTPRVAARLGRQAEHDVQRPTGNLRDLRRPCTGRRFGSRAEGQQFLLGRVEPGRQQRGPAFEPAGACQHWEQAIAQPLGRSPAQGGWVVLARHSHLCRQASSLRTLGQFRCGTITGAASPLRRGRLVRLLR
jgi:hypothetical protein